MSIIWEYFKSTKSTVLLFHFGLMPLAVSWGYSQHGHWHGDMLTSGKSSSTFHSSWDNPHLAHKEILGPENIAPNRVLRPLGSRRATGWYVRTDTRTHRHTDTHTDGPASDNIGWQSSMSSFKQIFLELDFQAKHAPSKQHPQNLKMIQYNTTQQGKKDTRQYEEYTEKLITMKWIMRT